MNVWIEPFVACCNCKQIVRLSLWVVLRLTHLGTEIVIKQSPRMMLE